MSNCDFVAGKSLINLVAARLSHRALALCAVSASTRPNQSVQRLPRQLTVKVRVWKKRPELQAHSRFTIQDGCGLPVATGPPSPPSMLLSPHTRRREFIAGLGGVATWPVVARAQQGDRVRRIGLLMAGDENDPVRKTLVSAFTQALADVGWTDGRNVRMAGWRISLADCTHDTRAIAYVARRSTP